MGGWNIRLEERKFASIGTQPAKAPAGKSDA
jgi:hypothetical protein